MEMTRLSLALFLPWALGAVWLRAGWRKASQGAWAMVLGYGYLVGTFALTFLMRLWDAAGLHQDFWRLAIAVAILTSLGLWAQPSLKGWGGGWLTGAWRAQTPWQKAAWGCLLALSIIAFAALALEVALRPLYPWDAWMHWAPKARVWFEWKKLVPFVSGEAWVQTVRPDVYTMDAYHYPPTVPLIQLWMALALDRWDDALINLPWWFCGAALGLAFYGQARLWGVGPLMAMLAVFLLLSLPFLETHIALAGYADLWLAAAYGGAAMAFWQWVRTGSLRQGALALVLALACTQIKLAGLPWLLTLLLAAVGLQRWGRLALVLLAGAGLVALPWLYGVDLTLLGKHFSLTFHDVTSPLLTHLFLWDSWHLFWYLAGMAAISALISHRLDRVRAAVAMTVLAALAFIGALFFWTSFAIWVEQGTLVNRMLLHMVPMAAFAVLIGLRR